MIIRCGDVVPGHSLITLKDLVKAHWSRLKYVLGISFINYAFKTTKKQLQLSPDSSQVTVIELLHVS